MRRRVQNLIIYSLILSALLLGINSCSKNSSNPTGPAKSSADQILSFTFQSLNPQAVGVVNNAAKTVIVTVPASTDRSSLTPTITISDNATISPASNIPENFNSPVLYTVTAEDGSKAIYTVIVTPDTTNTQPLTLTGTMDTDQTLKDRNNGIDYIIDGSFWVQGNALLTIEAGVTIAFTGVDGYMLVTENAGLKITGTADKPVIFMGPTGNPNKGSWNGIEINSNRADNQWDYVQIVNAGTQTDAAALKIDSYAMLSMRHCSITGSLGYGLLMNSLAKINEYKYNIIANCDNYPFYCNDLTQVSPLDITSSFSGNNYKFIFVYGTSYIDKDMTINNLDVPYFVPAIGLSNGTLIIKPGSTILFDQNGDLTISGSGILNAAGTSSAKITLTAKTQNPAYWYGVRINNNMPNLMSNCIIEYAGIADGANLDISDGKITLTDCTIQNSGNYGIIINNATSVTHNGIITFNNCPGGNIYNYDESKVYTTLP